jgi:hypothetical protein
MEDAMDNMEDLKKLFRTASTAGAAVVASLLVFCVFEEILRAKLRPFTGFAAFPAAANLRYLFYGLAVLEVLVIRLLQGLLLKRVPGDTFGTTAWKLLRASMVTVCLSEIPAILGFALFLIGGFNRDFYALLAVSLVLVFMYFPRMSSWRTWIERNT